MKLRVNWQKKNGILFVDQGVSAFTNYALLLIPFAQREWKTLGEMALFQSFYVLFIGISRAALGTTQILSGKNTNIKQLLVYGLYFSLISSLISFPFLVRIDISPIIILIVFISPIFQDILRFTCITRNFPTKALKSDLLWLFTSIVIFVCIEFVSSSSTSNLIISWSLGALPAGFWTLIKMTFGMNSNLNTGEVKVSLRQITRLGTTAFLSEINTIGVNWVITLYSSAILLGNFRFYQICFLPIAFLINVNRILLLSLFRNGDLSSVNTQTRIQNLARLFLYPIGIFMALILKGFQLENLFLSIITALAVECAFRRNSLYQVFISTNDERSVIKNLTAYCLLSLSLFLLVISTQNLSLLTICLLTVELIAFALCRSSLRSRS